MIQKGSNYYFGNYEEVKSFLLERNFKFEIPIMREEDLEAGRRQYCIEIRDEKIVYCAVEYLGNGLIFDTQIFYDDRCPFIFILSNPDELVTFSEAAGIFGLKDSSTLRHWVSQRKFEESEIQKKGNVWLVKLVTIQKILRKMRK